MYNSLFKEIKIQYIDMGIAMCHFEMALKDQGISGKWIDKSPSIALHGLEYVISFTLEK